MSSSQGVHPSKSHKGIVSMDGRKFKKVVKRRRPTTSNYVKKDKTSSASKKPQFNFEQPFSPPSDGEEDFKHSNKKLPGFSQFGFTDMTASQGISMPQKQIPISEDNVSHIKVIIL